MPIRPPCACDAINARNVGDDADVGDAGDAGGYIYPPLRNDVSVSTIIQWFKIMTTTEYIRNVKQSGWMPFNRRVWQRNYYEHIMRDQRELEVTRRYILENPVRWVEQENLDALLAHMAAKE